MKNNRKISIFFFYIGIVLSGCNKYIDTKGRLISSNGFSLKSYEDYNDFRCFSNMVSTMDTFRTVPTHFKVKLPKGILYNEIMGNSDFGFYYRKNQVIFIKVFPFTDEKYLRKDTTYIPSYNEMEDLIEATLITSNSKLNIKKMNILKSRKHLIFSQRNMKILLFNIEDLNVEKFKISINR